MIDLRRLTMLVHVARNLLETDRDASPAEQARAWTKVQLNAFFADWESDGESFTVEERQAVLFLASAMHREIVNALAPPFVLSRDRFQNFDKLAVSIGPKSPAPKRGKGGLPDDTPTSPAFDIQAAIDGAENVTRLPKRRAPIEDDEPNGAA